MELVYRKGKPIIPQYLEAMQIFYKKTTFKDNNHFKWMLKNGKAFGALKITKELERKIYKKYRYYGKLKACYYNSQMVAMNSIKSKYPLEYWEGYYVTDFMLPIEHGFCVYNGTVIDPTAYNRKFKVQEYFGIRIPIEDVAKHQIKTGMSEAMLWRIWQKKMEQGDKNGKIRARC